ncbi:response regulator [Opitutaceae bacterium TAV4]|nr:response regulator [Opitutaceae bacterium TAV4]RRK02647.1 response regulator [Opitutaceae bacterium TAV3]
MPHLLLLDDQLAAQRVFLSILERDDHRCDVATTPAEAWALLCAQVRYDLAVVELKLGGGGNGMEFIRQVRTHPLLRDLPLVVYTMVSERKVVRTALDYLPQNYLIKPYDDEIIHQEIAKATEQPWLASVITDEARALRQTDMTVEALRGKRSELAAALSAAAAPSDPGWASLADASHVGGSGDPPSNIILSNLAALATEAAAPGIERWLRDLAAQVAAPAGATPNVGDSGWPPGALENLVLAARLVRASFEIIRPGVGAPEDGASSTSFFFDTNTNTTNASAAARAAEEEESAQEEQERRRWQCASPTSDRPLVDPRSLLAQAAGLPGCPIIASVAAAFQMAVNAHLSNLSPIQHLVIRDPGLAAQILMSANRLDHDEIDPIGGLRSAVGWLGNARLQALCRSLVMVDERHLRPLSWTQFWMFQVGVAHMAEFVCQALEWGHMVRPAYNAGLMHDIGQLVLLRLHPCSFQAITRHARHCQVPREEAERRYLGCTAREAGEALARTHRLPENYTEVIRHAGHPEMALRHRDLVAVVSLARYLCLKYQIGDCGEWAGDLPAKVEETSAWPILNEQVYLGFNWRRFTMQAHLRIQRLKNELRGRAP